MIRKAEFIKREGDVWCQITEGPVHGDTVTEFYIGDWQDAQGFVNKLQRSIFMKDANL
jgi:hypothetical protein